MSKKDCQLNHSRDLSTSYIRENHFYDIERSKATAKQIKFYRSLWYKFKDNGLDINEECDKRNISHAIIQQPSGRAEYSQAIDTMIKILSEHDIYHGPEKKAEGEFVPTYNVQESSKIGGKRVWQSVEHKA